MDSSRIHRRKSPDNGPDRGPLPQLTPGERDFWRRAVAEERRRLELVGHDGPRKMRAGLN